MTRGNPNKLVPQNMRTKQEQSEIAKKGGIASGEARREKKSMQEALKTLLATPIDGKAFEELADKIPGLTPQMTVENAMLMAQAYKAIRGDTSAAVFCRDTSGEKPTDKIEHNTSNDELIAAYSAAASAIKNRRKP